MAITLRKKEDKLEKNDAVATPVVPATPFVDRSDMLFEQMSMIAWNNKLSLHLN